MRTHQQTNDHRTAIGYVRVSTQEQATDGVSLDAQRDKLSVYCKLNAIKLIDIKADKGYSGSTLERPRQNAQVSGHDREPALGHRAVRRRIERQGSWGGSWGLAAALAAMRSLCGIAVAP